MQKGIENNFFINAYMSPSPYNKNGDFDVANLDKGYKLLKEAGFTHALAFYETIDNNLDILKKTIEISHKYGISYIGKTIYTGRKYNEEKFIKSLENIKELDIDGLLLFDEPGLNELNILNKEIELFKSSLNKFPYFNIQGYGNPDSYYLNGMWTEINENDHIFYDNYLKTVFEKIKPDYLSFDFYPFFVDKEIKDEYFYQLGVISNFSKVNNIPFYPYIQACSWDNLSRIPTYEEIMFQCSMSLAYGAKGLQYFTFQTAYSNSENRYNVGIIDINFNTTIRYASVKDFNLFLKTIENDIFMLDYIKTIHTNSLDYKEFNVIGKDMVIGIYEKNNDVGLIIANNNLKESNEFIINHNNIWKEINVKSIISIINNKKALILNAGECVFITTKGVKK